MEKILGQAGNEFRSEANGKQLANGTDGIGVVENFTQQPRPAYFPRVLPLPRNRNVSFIISVFFYVRRKCLNRPAVFPGKFVRSIPFRVDCIFAPGDRLVLEASTFGRPTSRGPVSFADNRAPRKRFASLSIIHESNYRPRLLCFPRFNFFHSAAFNPGFESLAISTLRGTASLPTVTCCDKLRPNSYRSGSKGMLQAGTSRVGNFLKARSTEIGESKRRHRERVAPSHRIVHERGILAEAETRLR